MTTIEIQFGTPEYDEAIRLRFDILREPLGLEYSAEQIAAEITDYHLGIYNNGFALTGYLCLTPSENGAIKMRQVAVAQSAQNQGLGKELVKFSEIFAKQKGFKKMALHARETAVPFYIKLGYSQIGERFEEVGIPHFYMEKPLK